MRLSRLIICAIEDALFLSNVGWTCIGRVCLGIVAYTQSIGIHSVMADTWLMVFLTFSTVHVISTIARVLYLYLLHRKRMIDYVAAVHLVYSVFSFFDALWLLVQCASLVRQQSDASLSLLHDICRGVSLNITFASLVWVVQLLCSPRGEAKKIQ